MGEREEGNVERGKRVYRMPPTQQRASNGRQNERQGSIKKAVRCRYDIIIIPEAGLFTVL